jgi:hypothetical protein
MAPRRGQWASDGIISPGRSAPGQQLVSKRAKSDFVGFPPRPDHHVPRRHRLFQLPPPHFFQPTAQTIAGHRGGLELRNDESHPRMARRIVCPQHIEMRKSLSPSRALHPLELRSASEPALAGEPLVCRQRPPCLEGTLTVRRLRPFFRRRESTSRPHRSAIRARNPCRLRRLRLRGR